MTDTSELMTPCPVVIPSDEALAVAARLLARHGFRHLPVIDDQGALCGILYDHDVFRVGALALNEGSDIWLPLNPAMASAKARDLMRPARVVVRADTPLRETLSRLTSNGDDIAIVTDDAGHVQGLLTEHDGTRFGLAVLPADALAVHAAGPAAITTPSAALAVDVLGQMTLGGGRHAVIVDGAAVIGVVSHRDLIAEDALRHPTMRIDAINPHQRPLTAPVSCPLLEAARTLAKRRIGCLPLLAEDGTLKAVLTRADVVRATTAALND